MRAKIKTIDIQAKEWFDKINGNSYFSAIININYGLKSQTYLELPFQYGYGDHYRDMAFKAIKKNINKAILKAVDKHQALWYFCQENDIILRCSKHENCLKRELFH
jgi:hypothetical protein